jgi:hypothetical protein
MPLAHMRPAQPRDFVPATYGELVRRLDRSVTDALIASIRPPISSTVVATEGLGAERFLRAAGCHLQLLAATRRTDSVGWRQLAELLSTLPPSDHSVGEWSHAARLVATAHDILACHVSASGEPRTPEGDAAWAHRGIDAVALRLTEYIDLAAVTCQRLLTRAEQHRINGHEQLLTQQERARLRRLSRSVPVYSKAVRWDLRDNQSQVVTPLDSLGPPLNARAVLSQSSTGELTDLVRLLRRTIRAQSLGLAPASHTSLRDFALLAARVTDPDLRHEVPGDRALERLKHAHRMDQLEVTHRRWLSLATDLERHVFSLTKAPTEYSLVVQRLMRIESRPTIDALSSVLPVLGHQTALTVRGLSEQGLLVTSQREAGEVTRSWRPIPAADSRELSQRFAENAAASQALLVTEPPSAPDPRPVATIDSRTLEALRSRGVET